MSMTLGLAVQRVTVKCGKRDDIHDQAVDAVNMALNTILSMHETPFSYVFHQFDLPVDGTGIVALPDEVSTVVGVGLFNSETKETIQLKLGGYGSTVNNPPASKAPMQYVQIGKRLFITPVSDTTYPIRVLSKRALPYFTDEDDELPIPSELEPSLILLAAALVRVDLGDVQVAGTLRNFASMMGSLKFGPEAISRSYAAASVKPGGV